MGDMKQEKGRCLCLDVPLGQLRDSWVHRDIHRDGLRCLFTGEEVQPEIQPA